MSHPSSSHNAASNSNEHLNSTVGSHANGKEQHTIATLPSLLGA
jgi:hypothetical protein